MKILIIFMLLMTQAYARDCLKETWNFHVGMKLTYSMNDLIERYAEQKDITKACDEKSKNSMMNDEITEMVKGYHQRRKELLRKGDVSSDILEFGYSIDEKHLSEKELCIQLDEKIKEEEDCYLPRSYLVKLKDADFTTMRFREICREHLPILYKNYKNCRRR